MDVEVNYGAVCNKVFALVSPPTFVSIAGTTITVNASAATAGDVGT
jgi:hypothetical protein